MSSDDLKPLAVSIPEAARLQGLGRSKGGGRNSIYGQIERGEVVAINDGPLTRITMASIVLRVRSKIKYGQANRQKTKANRRMRESVANAATTPNIEAVSN